MAEGSLADRIFGLPIYQPSWAKDEVYIYMGKFNRPYEKLSMAELTKLMGEQLKTGRDSVSGKDGTVYIGGNRGVPVATKAEWSISTGSSSMAPTPKTTRAPETETMFRMGPDGPEAVTRIKKTGEVDDLTWLRQRVAEICWSPR